MFIQPTSAYASLCSAYLPALLAADESYRTYLDKIGQLYFGMPAKTKKPAGIGEMLLNNLFKGGLHCVCATLITFAGMAPADDAPKEPRDSQKDMDEEDESEQRLNDDDELD